MLFCLIGTTIILGGIIGFADTIEGALHWQPGGQIVQGVLSIACFILVGVAFWRFGWKIGLLDLLLVIIASNVGLALHRVRLPRP
jgi:multisubunit Na+/H+ antiporter MnhB subunit